MIIIIIIIVIVNVALLIWHHNYCFHRYLSERSWQNIDQMSSYLPSYHVMSYHIILYHIISYHITSYHIMSYHIISYHIISYHITSYHIISYHIISYHIILPLCILLSHFDYIITSYYVLKMEKLQAYAASLACPVGAIRLKSPDPLMKKVLEIFPAEVFKLIYTQLIVVSFFTFYYHFFHFSIFSIYNSIKKSRFFFVFQIDPQNIPGVMHAGFHSTGSFGATPYFIKRSAGNIMIDLPRYNSR